MTCCPASLGFVSLSSKPEGEELKAGLWSESGPELHMDSAGEEISTCFLLINIYSPISLNLSSLC